MRILIVLVSATLLAGEPAPTPLRDHAITLKPPIPDTGIVGRAWCGGATWLLNQSSELIRLAPGASRPSIRRVSEFRPNDQLLGLACLDDGSLWTLQTAHVLARLTPDGAVAERHTFLFPQVRVFGIGDRLVFLSLPIVANRSVLTTSPRQEPTTVRAWAGLVARKGLGSRPDLVANLAACGMGFQGMLPCWFGDDDHVSIGNGREERSVSLPWLRSEGIGQAAPIRDLALVRDGMWVLAAATTSVSGRRVGELLVRTDAAGVVQRSLRLKTKARLIASADVQRCALVTVGGDVIVVSE